MSVFFLPELTVCAQSCSDEKLAFNKSHRERVLGTLPGRVSCLKLESFRKLFFFFKP